MTGTELIGEVGKLYLKAALGTADAGGTARFLLDRLTAAQTAEIARAILRDPALSADFEIKLPIHFMEGQNLPAHVLTLERATFHRHANCSKPALLLANTGDDEEQSLNLVVPVGSLQLMNHPDLWVRVANGVLSAPLDTNHCQWWERALKGLFDLNFRSMEQISSYVVGTTQAIADGHAVTTALGFALPELQLPRDSDYCKSIKEKQRTYASKWKTLFSNADKKRACYLRKLSPSQVALNSDDLEKAFVKVKDAIRVELHPLIENFIVAPPGWNHSVVALAKCEWSEIEPLFTGLRPEKLNLAEITLQFYDENYPDILTDGDIDYLNRLKERKTRLPEDEDQEFYSNHRNELKDDRKLKSLWDKFMFGAPRETEDFLAGLMLSMEVLFNHHEAGQGRTITVRGDHRTKADFKELNVNAGTYFATRYKGLRPLLGSNVKWAVGDLFDFPDLIAKWKERPKPALNYSESKASLHLRFVIELESIGADGNSVKDSTQLVWRFNPNTVASELESDWNRLVEHPLVFCSTHRESVSGKGQFQSVDLSNAKTFGASYAKDRGSFVAVYRKDNDIGKKWIDNIAECLSQKLIDDQTAAILQEKWQTFESAYREAVRGFAEQGLNHPQLVDQASAYGDLLDALCRQAKGDRSRDLLLKPLLQIGVVGIYGGSRPASIVAPWHPLRLAAIAIKAKHAAGLLNYLLTAAEIDFGDTRLFFKEAQTAQEHPFYPEIVLGWHGSKPELLSMSDVVADYTLHELPLADKEKWEDTNENPSEAADRLGELAGRYLKLNPHEQANFSVVLYNCDSARLPQAVVDKLGAMNEDEEDVRCQIILRHIDSRRLRSLYQKIIESLDTDVDSFNASEATKDFMARLRIGIEADQAPVPDPKDGCPSDIVFSQDVIARHAKLEWYATDARPVAIESLVPSQWSRRKPAAKDDMKSVVFLCCPAQIESGWAYLTAITTFFKGDWDANESKRLLPARQLDFQDPHMTRIFEETHNLGTWVVNYDELLDRRQLINQSVRVIRYKQSATQGRNLIISSRAPLDLLRSMVLKRIQDLGLGLTAGDEINLAERFIEDANKISGEIVLRAAKRGRNASELIGVVLSAFLIRQELGVDRYYGWYFLDDYASWLGQREEQIADILALSPEIDPDGGLRLAIIISEAKYIQYGGLRTKRKESQKQLLDTVKRIDDALFASPERLDRDIWLSRFSDLVLNGIEFPANAPIDLSAWRRAMREGTCEIYLRGYSHVFVSGPSDSPECSDFGSVSRLENGYQEVFSRSRTAELVRHYWHQSQPLEVRRENARNASGDDVWLEEIYKTPAKGTITVKTPGKVLKDQNVPLPNSQEPTLPAVTNPTITTAEGLKVPDETELPVVEKESSGWAYSKVLEIIESGDIRSGNEATDIQWLKQAESQCKGALQQFQLHSKLVSSSLTPNAALLKFQGSADLTVEQVLKRRSEFLTTHRLNIISVRAEPGLVSIAVARPHREVLEMPEVWRRWTPHSANGNQELVIGVREEDSSLQCLSPRTNAPHTLIAGSTGSGKSVLMQNIILGIAATNSPQQAQIVLIDPKLGVDYFAFEGLPHLKGGIIEDQETAIEQLTHLVSEMQRRYTVLKQNKVPNIFELNKKPNATEYLPFLWVIHDEFADWMMTEEYRDAVTDIVGRLGAKARAAGIALVFAAQRPDANVMPMQLRANLGNRLILRVDGEGTSEIALGEKGAERLLGKGHMAAKLEGEPSIVFVQVPFIAADLLERCVTAIIDSSHLPSAH